MRLRSEARWARVFKAWFAPNCLAICCKSALGAAKAALRTAPKGLGAAPAATLGAAPAAALGAAPAAALGAGCPRNFTAWLEHTKSSSNVVVVVIESVDGIMRYVDQPPRTNPLIEGLVSSKCCQNFGNFWHQCCRIIHT